jgi:hypothetical protein
MIDMVLSLIHFNLCKRHDDNIHYDDDDEHKWIFNMIMNNNSDDCYYDS